MAGVSGESPGGSQQLGVRALSQQYENAAISGAAGTLGKARGKSKHLDTEPASGPSDPYPAVPRSSTPDPASQVPRPNITPSKPKSPLNPNPVPPVPRPKNPLRPDPALWNPPPQDPVPLPRRPALLIPHADPLSILPEESLRVRMQNGMEIRQMVGEP